MRNINNRKYFLVINQKAGGKSSSSRIQALFDSLQSEKIKYDYAFTEKSGHATMLTQRAIDNGYNVIVAVGGDGTVNEVAKGIVGTDAKLGIIPIGSGNGLARELNISMKISKAISNLISNFTKETDVWEINDQIFLCTSGIGFDAHIASKMSQMRKRGVWKYVYLVIKECIFYKPISINLVLDNSNIRAKAFMLTFANASQFGNNAFIAPTAKIDDKKLDIILIKPFIRVLLPIVGLSVFSKTILLFPFVKRYSVSKAILESSSTNTFHFDGEIGTLNYPVDIIKAKNTIEIICD